MNCHRTEQVLREDALPAPASGFARAPITLGRDERLHGYGRRRSDSGIAVGLSLPRGTMLRGGDCLVRQAKTIVLVVERSEPVFLIEPHTPQEWGIFAYDIGNRLQPLMIFDAGAVCPGRGWRRTAPGAAPQPLCVRDSRLQARHLGVRP